MGVGVYPSVSVSVSVSVSWSVSVSVSVVRRFVHVCAAERASVCVCV